MQHQESEKKRHNQNPKPSYDSLIDLCTTIPSRSALNIPDVPQQMINENVNRENEDIINEEELLAILNESARITEQPSPTMSLFRDFASPSLSQNDQDFEPINVNIPLDTEPSFMSPVVSPLIQAEFSAVDVPMYFTTPTYSPLEHNCQMLMKNT
jgi:hypothetical protein